MDVPEHNGKWQRGQWLVYALVDPDSAAVRYVGQTRKGARTRMLGHLSAARRGKQGPLSDWLRRLLSEGKEPSVVVLISIQDHTIYSAPRWAAQYAAKKAEEFLIHSLSDGRELLNREHHADFRRWNSKG